MVPPSINHSGGAFEVEGSAIHYSLAALKGVGTQAVEAIVAARGARSFAHLSDFASRINPRAVNKRVDWLEKIVYGHDAAGPWAMVCVAPSTVFATV